MITITTKGIEQLVKEETPRRPVIERLDLDLHRAYYGQETIYFTRPNAGRDVILPISSIWENEKEKVSIHISPDDYSFDRRVCGPKESLQLGENRTEFNGEYQYQIVISPKGNIM